jgi:CBS domain-containing protein
VKVSTLISVQKLISCTSSDSLDHVRALMNDNHIRHVPVIENHSLIGVLSMRDIVAADGDSAKAQRESAAA